jgi:hypothetical protein
MEEILLDNGSNTVVVTNATQLDTTVTGGTGSDVLKLYATMSADLTGTQTYTNFNTIDMTTTSANVSLSIDLAGLTSFTQASSNLVILGNSGDALSVTSGTMTHQSSGSGYNNFIAGQQALSVSDSVAIKITGSGTITGFDTADFGETIIGSSGNDTIYDKNGADSVDAGSGNDTVYIYDDNSADHFDGCDGTDTIQLDGDTLVTVNLNANTTNSSIVRAAGGTDSFTKFESLALSSFNDVINMSGATGYTLVNGRGGDDTFNVTTSSAVSLLAGGAGADSFNISAAFTGNLDGADDVDTFDLSGAVTGTITAGAGNDVIELRSGGSASLIQGEAGADILNLRGGSATSIDLGSDNDVATIYSGSTVATLYGNVGDDTLTYDAGFGSVATFNITGVGTGTLTDTDGTNIAFSDFENIYSTAQPDTITVSGGSLSTLDAGAGADSITITSGNITSLIGGSEMIRLQLQQVEALALRTRLWVGQVMTPS